MALLLKIFSIVGPREIVHHVLSAFKTMISEDYLKSLRSSRLMGVDGKMTDLFGTKKDRVLKELCVGRRETSRGQAFYCQ